MLLSDAALPRDGTNLDAEVLCERRAIQIIGALAWSITASAAEVTLDLFFDEDANLGCASHEALQGYRG